MGEIAFVLLRRYRPIPLPEVCGCQGKYVKLSVLMYVIRVCKYMYVAQIVLVVYFGGSRHPLECHVGVYVQEWGITINSVTLW